MIRPNRTLLVLRALYELFRYDLVEHILGFRGILKSVARARIEAPGCLPAIDEVCQSVETAGCLYFKPVRCLQRSVVTTRLLRKRGAPAELVVGYRSVPFMSHAWVEVNGKIVNDSAAYRELLQVLTRA